MRTRLLLLLAYFPLAAVLVLLAVQLLPTSSEAIVKESFIYMPLVAFASVASAGVLLWTLFHLYRRNDEVDGSERLRWTVALLFASIFAVPEYVKRFVVPVHSS